MIEGRSAGIGDLLKELRDDTTRLLRQEVDLAKTEVSEKLTSLSRNLGFVAGGALVTIVGATLIFQAITAMVVLALNALGFDTHSSWLAPLLVGSIVAAIGANIAMKGVAAIKSEPLIPTQTLDTLKEDKEWIQQKVS